MNEISDIKRELSSRAGVVCEMLLPAGKLIRGEWEVGSIGGEAGKSLKVCTKGPKAGVWSDFAAGAGGDLIDLWQQVRGQSLVEALDDIRDYLGMERPTFTQGKREYAKPPKPQCSAPKSRVKDYLTEDRNIPEEILTKYKIGERGETIIFPFLRDGELIMAKEREAVDGAKPKPTAAGCEKILFGWQAIDDNAREVTITEGEIDALSMSAYGFPALSVPYGGGGGNKQDWIENEFDNLARFETIYLALDMDTEGEKAVEEIIKRLGRHRCLCVQLPYKDANDCLVEGVSQSVIATAFKDAESIAPPTVTRVNEYTDNVVNLFWPQGDKPEGYTFQQPSLRDKVFFRPGEVTVWTGATGSGKSQILSDCSVGWISEGSRVCVASLEMAPAQTLKRMVKQAGGTDRPAEPYIKTIMDWLHDGLWIYNVVGKERVTELLDAFDYCRARYGCDQFVVDSLMRLGIASDDYNGQEQAMFQIVNWAIKHGVHVHLVAHSRKQGANETGPQDVESVKGASEIGANAFNVVSVWRDKGWEEAKDNAEEGEATDKVQGYLDAGGVVLNVAKQRNGDWTGRVRLHFDIETYQYRCNKSALGPRAHVEIPEALRRSV
jgi:twinkle protein